MTGNTSAEVVDFPGTPWDEAEHGTVTVPRAELAEVVDSVIVDDEPAVSRPPSVVLAIVVRPVQVIQVVVKHDHAKTAGRHLAYIPLGAPVRGQAPVGQPHDGPLRAVHPGGRGQPATMRRRWSGTTRMQRFLKDRHQRRVDMIELPLRVLLAVPKIALGLFVVLAVIGIFLAIGTKHFAEIVDAVRGGRAASSSGSPSQCRSRGVRSLLALPWIAWARCGGPAGLTPTPT